MSVSDGPAESVAPLNPSPEPSVATVALVHDYLLVLRGAERTFAAIAELWPEAPVLTLLHDPPAVAAAFARRRVLTSPLQRLGLRQKGFRALLPLMPAAASRLPVGDADLVVSSSSAFAHGVRLRAGAVHVCYCHTPFRYAWHERDRGLLEAPSALRPALAATLSAVRHWDLRASERVTRYIANSRITQQRIGDFWQREAVVVHPPVAVERFAQAEPEDYFLYVGELTRHKRVEVAIAAARRAEVPLRVVGTGPDLVRLTALHGEHVDFAGRVDDRRLAEMMARARALIVPNVEEFGIAAVESQAAGRPVVAAAAGGALETVIAGETGVFFAPDDVDALAEILRHQNFDHFAPAALEKHAQEFSTQSFQERMRAAVAEAVAGPLKFFGP